MALNFTFLMETKKMKNQKQIRQKIEQENHNRSVIIERSAVDEEKRTVEIAFSSEDPYRRWYGVEILGHEKDEVDMEFMASGRAPFLSGHNHNDQIAVIERAWIDNDRVGRAVVRFGKSARAEELFQDVIDGIRQNISVGYSIVEAKLIEEHEDEPDVYRMKWRPFEASLVSVPADTTVGVGREKEFINQNIEVRQMTDEEKKAQEKAAQKAIEEAKAKAAKEARKGEIARIGEIDALGKAHGFEKEAAKAVEDGQDVDKFRSFVLDELKKKNITPVENFTPEIGLTAKEAKQFSFIKAIYALANPNKPDAQRAAAFELECSEAVGKKLKKDSEGLFIPVEVQARDLTVGTATAGGHTVATNLLAGSFIDMLQNRMMVQRMGATVLTDLVGDIAIPRQTGGATCYWVAESGDPTESQQAFDQVTMSPNTVGAFTDISRKLLLQSSISIENFVRGDLAKVLALGIDLAGINGSGSSNQPTGILNVSGIGAVAGGTNGLAPAWSHIIDLWTQVAQDNADVGALGYLTNSQIIGRLMQTEKASGTAQFVAKDFPDKDGMTGLGGARCGVSNQVPSNLDKGTSTGVCSAIIYGNWADLLIGMWGGLSITVDPYTQATSGTVRVVVLQDVDLAVRHAESFAAMQDALTA
jgi:HK97 family phage major capsid protein